MNVLVSDGDTRWLDDYGTGSYVDPSLHWYRSTLAHSAPLVDGTSQLKLDGVLRAYDERGAAGWITASAGIAPGASAERTVVVMPDYLIDGLTWRADREVTFDLPIHADIVVDSGAETLRVGVLEGGAGTEDGFRFVHDSHVQRAAAGSVVQGSATSASGELLRIWARSDRDSHWWRTFAPGPPGEGERAFRLVRASGATGRHESVLAWSDRVAHVEMGEGTRIRVALTDGSSHVHQRRENGWHIELHAGGATSGIDLAGIVAPRVSNVETRSSATTPAWLDVSGAATRPTIVQLGERHYRRSEERWVDAGGPTADVSLWWSGGVLHISVDVHQSHRTFPGAAAVNTYDNESPDINGDSIQLYLSSDKGLGAWILVPETDSTRVRIRQLEGWSATAVVSAAWAPLADGYRMDIEIGDCVPTALDLLVNEMPVGRERRRGQLVLSESRGEFVYLRGDRHVVDRLIQLRLADG